MIPGPIRKAARQKDKKNSTNEPTNTMTENLVFGIRPVVEAIEAGKQIEKSSTFAKAPKGS